jgi:hypothetical protein
LRYIQLANSTIFFDGMTIQQVGEVVCGADSTAAIRPICVESYIRALQEFAFAIVFGGGFGTNPDLPNVGKDRPGMELIEDSALQGLFHPLQRSLGNPRLRDLLSGYSFKQSVLNDIARFPADAAGVFSEWLTREICAYPLEEYEAIGPDEIRFGSRTYLTRPDIELLLPLGKQERLVSCLRRHLKGHGQEPLLRRFVQVNAFNLVGISRMYEQGLISVQRSESFFRIPHPTRAQILLNMRQDYDKEKLFGTLRAFALVCSLQNISSRQEFLRGLVASRSTEPVKTLRQLIGDLEVETNKRAVEMLYRTMSGELSKIVPGTTHPERDISVRINRHRDLLQFVGSTAGDVDYRKKVFRVFPELDSTRPFLVISAPREGILKQYPDGMTGEKYHQVLDRLASGLDQIPKGRRGAKKFEEFVGQLIRLCFFRSLGNVHEQVRSLSPVKIRDWIAGNVADAGFWHWMRTLLQAQNILWECKNYAKLKSADFSQVKNYMNAGVGRLAIIAFRGRVKKTDYERVRDIRDAGLVLLLGESDLKDILHDPLEGNDVDQPC